MGLVSRLVRSANWSIDDLDTWMNRIVGGRPLWTGRTMTAGDSMQVVTVYACVTLLCDMVASLPLFLYRRIGGGTKSRAFDMPLYPLLHDSPNSEMTAYQWRECLMGHLLLWGNHYSQIVRDGYGNILSLWPLRPDRMEIARGENGSLRYVYRLKTGEPRALLQTDILHVRAMTYDGIVGIAPIEQCRQAIGLAAAEEEFGSRFFGNSARPDGVLTHPGTLKPEAVKRLKAGWESLHQGLDNSHRIAILEEGVTWSAIGVQPEHAQFLESRKFQRGEIESIFRVPPSEVGDVERSTSWGSGIEQQSIGFVTRTVRPWLVRIEQQMTKDLLGDAEKGYLFIEHLIDGLLRGDLASRYTAYATARQWGWMSVNDIRRLENMNALGEKGDEYLVPLNMIEAGTKPPPAPAPEPAAEPAAEEDAREQARTWYGGFVVPSLEEVYALPPPKNGARRP